MVHFVLADTSRYTVTVPSLEGAENRFVLPRHHSTSVLPFVPFSTSPNLLPSPRRYKFIHRAPGSALPARPLPSLSSLCAMLHYPYFGICFRSLACPAQSATLHARNYRLEGPARSDRATVPTVRWSNR